MGIELESQEYSYLITLIAVLHILGWISVFEVGMISVGIVDFIGEVCNGAGRLVLLQAVNISFGKAKNGAEFSSLLFFTFPFSPKKMSRGREHTLLSFGGGIPILVPWFSFRYKHRMTTGTLS